MAICDLNGQSGGKSLYEFDYPTDWIDIRNPATGKIELLVGDFGTRTVAFAIATSTGNFTVDWGDGSAVESVVSSTQVQHTYTEGAGQACSKGYTTFKITISPTTGNLKQFLLRKHSLNIGSSTQPILAAVCNSTSITTLSFYNSIIAANSLPAMEYFKSNAVITVSLASAFYFCVGLKQVDFADGTQVTNISNIFANCESLIRYKLGSVTSAATNATSAFQKCYSLLEVDFSQLVQVVTAASMFEGVRCIKKFKSSWMPNVIGSIDWIFSTCSLEEVDLSSWTGITSAAYAFQSNKALTKVTLPLSTTLVTVNNMFTMCYGLQSVDLSRIPNITNANGMFESCYNLRSVNISVLQNVTTATSMFNNCFNLDSLISTSFGLTAASVNLGNFANNSQKLAAINLPNAKLTAITCKGTSTVLAVLTDLTFHASSTFSGTSPQVDIQYNTISAAQLNTIFTALPTVTSKTINITGCTGAATCTRTIATAKGWTVTG